VNVNENPCNKFYHSKLRDALLYNVTTAYNFNIFNITSFGLWRIHYPCIINYFITYFHQLCVMCLGFIKWKLWTANTEANGTWQHPFQQIGKASTCPESQLTLGRYPVLKLFLTQDGYYTVAVSSTECRTKSWKKIENRLFDSVAQFKYLGLTITLENLIQEEIKWRLNSGNAWYHPVQNLLSFLLLSEIVKIGTYKAIILPVVLYGYENWSLTLREEQRLRVFPNRVLRRIFCPKRN
jgi:hypothetical protein